MKDSNRGPLMMLCISVLLVVFAYGTLVGRFRIFPYNIIAMASHGWGWAKQAMGMSQGWYYFPDRYADIPMVHADERTNPGLILVARVSAGNKLAVEVRDRGNAIVHSWNVDWFKDWPNPTHLREEEIPKAPPGTHVHGIVANERGEIVFNFEDLGLVKMDKDSNILWRLPIRTHHCVYRAASGNLWVCAFDDARNVTDEFPSVSGRYDEMVMEVSPDGQVLRKIHLIDLLEHNGLRGLLYVKSSLEPETIGKVSEDILHTNDVEVFPDGMEEGFFKHGDIMVSLRNISTILVFDPETQRVKFRSTGMVNQQHDPDFVDGNTITVLDNNPHYYKGGGLFSRIVEIAAPSGDLRVIFQGDEKHPFFTNIMGKHQWLPNGNLLITEAKNGRGFEVTPQGELVWEFRNKLDDNLLGLVDEVQCLSPEVSAAFMAH